MAKDKSVELKFPLKGLDVTSEYQEQPAGTTPRAVNVRTTEPLAARERGGSRPGLVKYIAGQIPAGTHLIQHLNVIVDPTSPALLTSDELSGYPTMDDPSDGTRNPGRKVRVGGSGVQPNRHVQTQAAPPPTIALVQAKVVNYEFGSARVEPTFDAQPGTNNLLICFTFQACDGPTGTDTTVFSDLGPYTIAGSYAEFEQGGNALRTGLFYRVSGAISSAADKTVKVDRAGDAIMTVILLEYSGTLSASPLDTETESAGVFTDPFMTTGNVDVGGAGEVVIGAFFSANQGPDSGVAGTGFTKIAEEEGGIEDPPADNDLQCFVIHKLGVSTDQEPTATFAGGGQNWCAKGASFKRGLG